MASPAVPKFDASTINFPPQSPPDASVAAASNREYLKEGDGFTLVFTLPFAREALYKELTSARQLGVDHTSVTISITKRTDSAQAELDRKLELSARAPAAIRQQEEEKAVNELSVGCERSVRFPDGVVVSQLVELVALQRIRWRQTKSERATNMVGKPGGALPEVTIALDELPDNSGTSIRMTYDFYQILKADGTPLDGAMMSKLLSQATRGWSADMKSRGYETVSGAEALTGRPGFSPGGGSTFDPSALGATVLRSARTMKSDVDEEESMKAAMMERAKASMKK